VGLAAMLEENADGLSYGAKRQLEVGLALATRPKVLLLDEPTSGVGPEETDLILGLLLALPRDIALVIVEHDMDLVFSLADRVTVLDAGRIIFEGTPEEARQSRLVREIYLGEFAGDA
jgi:branched-chain amino acid transport system ATP-binding protein